MREISSEQARQMGIDTAHHEMDNGERRFRLMRNQDSSYILTISAEAEGWQNSHVHHEKKEWYLVEQGWILIALLRGSQLEFHRLRADESLFVEPGVPHNVYISADSLVHTVKYGSSTTDWTPWPALDQLLKEQRQQWLSMIEKKSEDR